MHDDEKRAARRRETVTCLRDNGINKAGFSQQKGEGSELARSATVLPLCQPDFARIDFTGLLRLFLFLNRSDRTRSPSISYSKLAEWRGKIKRTFNAEYARHSAFYGYTT